MILLKEWGKEMMLAHNIGQVFITALKKKKKSSMKQKQNINLNLISMA